MLLVPNLDQTQFSLLTTMDDPHPRTRRVNIHPPNPPLPLLGQLHQLITRATQQLLSHHPPPLKPIYYLSNIPQSPISILRISYLASLSFTHLVQNRLITKRDIHYLSPLLFPNTALVDRALNSLAKLLCVFRNDLNIVAAPKGLVAGNLTFIDESASHVDVSMFGAHPCIIPSRPERMLHIATDACAVVVLEKESTFHSLLNEPPARQLVHTCIFITGKGYPDLATRSFLNRISNTQQSRGLDLPIYILTDADPHGLSIAMCYMTDLESPHVVWIGVRPSDNGSLFNLNPSSLLAITEREYALMNGLVDRILHADPDLQPRLSSLREEISFLRTTKVKFEIEALAVDNFKCEESTLLRYLLLRTQEEHENAFASLHT